MEYTEAVITVSPIIPFAEILMGELGDIGYESFVETDSGFKAYIPAKNFAKNILEETCMNMGAGCEISYVFNHIEDQNWNAVWESGYEPVFIEDYCFVHAPFHQKRTDALFNILIEPKMSFGTAHHPTTYLMISFLKDECTKRKRVLDMGCGTGVLSILACLKKASYVEAIDNDIRAYENTLENIRNNHCEKITAYLGDASLLSGKTFDLILANINRNILLNDLEKYASCLNTNGVLFMSGFFESDISIITEEAAKYGLLLKEKKIRGEWAALKMEF